MEWESEGWNCILSMAVIVFCYNPMEDRESPVVGFYQYYTQTIDDSEKL